MYCHAWVVFVLVLTHHHTQTCCLSSCTLSYSICALSNSLPTDLALSDLPIPNLALRPRAYLFLHALSGLLPMFSQACCLGILRLTFYVFSGSLPMYLFIGLLPISSQAHWLCILRLAVYLVSGSLPVYSYAHCLGILRLAAYVFWGSLSMYSQACCVCILRLTA